MRIHETHVARNLHQPASSLNQCLLRSGNEAATNPTTSRSDVNNERGDRANGLRSMQHKHLIQSGHALQHAISLGGYQGRISGPFPLAPTLCDRLRCRRVAKHS
jgi:hypothetical protein